MGEMIVVGLVILSVVSLAVLRRRRQRARLGGQALLQATEAGDLAQMQVLLKQGADVRARNAQGWTPLHIAAAGGDPAVVRLLLQHGAEVNAQSNVGITPLDNATARGGRQAVLDLLLAHGAQAHPSWDASL